MAHIIVIDAGPLGLASKPPGKPDSDRCRAWVRTLDASGARIVVPEIADYEVRRELIRAGATAGVRRLDRLESVLDYDPITTAAMRRAAEFWVVAQNAGLPTAHGHALDADCILAAQALLLSGPGDVVTVATTNACHNRALPRARCPALGNHHGLTGLGQTPRTHDKPLGQTNPKDMHFTPAGSGRMTDA